MLSFRYSFNKQKLIGLILLMLTIWSNQSKAISDFRKGYILKSENDTVWGFIKYSQGPKSNRTCIFKESEKGQIFRLSPHEIVGFGFVDDKKYISRKVHSSDNEVQIYLFEVLVNGSFSLLNLDNSFYVLNKDDELIKLNNIKTGSQPDRTKNQAVASHFTGILNLLMFDCIDIRDQVPKTRYSEKMLTRIVEQYHECKELPYISYKNQKPWIKTSVGFSLGYQQSDLIFRNPKAQWQHMRNEFTKSKNLLAGLLFEVSSPRVNEKLSFISSAMYIAPSYYAFRRIDNGGYIQNDYISISLHSLKIPAGFRYIIPGKKLSLYLNAGVSNTFNLITSSDYYTEYHYHDEVWTDNLKALQIKPYQFGYWGGIGVQKPVTGKYAATIEFRFDRSDRLSDSALLKFSDYMSSVSNFQFIVTLKTR